MAADDLVDFRGRITALTDCALEAELRATGADKAAIARAVLHEWAVKRAHAATVMHGLMQVNGAGGSDGGVSGNPRR